jgi:hypothetical protein
MRDQLFSVKLYRWLLRLYPPGFRENYSGPMEREFSDEVADADGTWALAAIWVRLIADLAVSVPAQLSL